MARRGRRTAEITLSTAERETLQRWSRRHASSQALALRSRIVLGCGEGRTDRDIAAEVGTHRNAAPPATARPGDLLVARSGRWLPQNARRHCSPAAPSNACYARWFGRADDPARLSVNSI
jgi:hypothetical protein